MEVLPKPFGYPSSAQYHALPFWSSSSLKLYADSPYKAFRRYVSKVDEPDASESLALRIGTAVNAAILGLTGAVYVAKVDSRRSKAYRDAELAFPKRTILTLPEHALATSVSDAILSPVTRAAQAAKHLLTQDEGHAEWFWQWTDSETGIGLRSMIDRLRLVGGKVTLIELKTTRDPSPIAFAKQIHDLRYDLQAVHNIAAVRHAMGSGEFDDRPELVWVAVRNEAPFEVAVYRLGEETYQHAEDRRRVLLRRLSEHLKDSTGSTWRAEWERLEDDIIPTIESPEWARRRST